MSELNRLFTQALSEFHEILSFGWSTPDIVTVQLGYGLHEPREEAITEALKNCGVREVRFEEPVLAAFWYADKELQLTDEQRATVRSALDNLLETMQACGIHQYEGHSTFPLVVRPKM